jgi:transposase
MALSKEQRERMTRKALRMQEKRGQRKSVLEPYKDWIQEMIGEQGITFRVLTQVLASECGIKISEQSLNEWYHRHIGRPPRTRKTAASEKRDAAKAGSGQAKTDSAGTGSTQTRPAKKPARKKKQPNLDYNQPDDWKIT